MRGEWSEATYKVAAPPPDGFDRDHALRSAVEHLKNTIACDTQNPPGNELPVAQYFESVLRELPGVESRIIPAGEGRANFIARIRSGTQARRAVLVMGHMDVVGADAEKWTSPPFTPTVRDGYLVGRGAIDDKGMLSASLAAFTQLAARREELTRDIVLLATAGEEGGPPVGVDDVVAKHFELIRDVEFALNEGGRVRVKNGKLFSVNIQTTEKVQYNVEMRARGRSGHASIPQRDNALAALARAAARVHEWRAPVRLNATTRIYFERLAGIEEDPELSRAMRSISEKGASRAQMEAAAEVLSRVPLHNAMLRAGQSLTMLDGGIRVNVIPAEGTAIFNLRVLPDDDPNEIVREMSAAAAEPDVSLQLSGPARRAPVPSPVTSSLFQAMEGSANAMAPDATVLPFMSAGATDGARLREAGIYTYGLLPMPLVPEDERRMHGEDERVPIPALGWASEYIYRTLLSVSRQ